MCGIVGFIGRSGSLQILVDSLQRLEYRGYDSAGVVFQNGKGLQLYKTRGKINELEQLLPQPAPVISAGLGHTRWATHGAPSSINAHPHQVEDIAVVHNGIIENYRELRTKLESEGHRFQSETDTEVVPHLIVKYMKRGSPCRTAIRSAVRQLRGTYALGIMSKSEPDVLYAVRKGSPLVLGFANDAAYFASDIPALLPYTKTFLFVEDGQLCTLNSACSNIRDVETDVEIPFLAKIVRIDWTPDMAEKGGYSYFMHKEIFDQPEAIRATMGGRIDDPMKFVLDLGLYFQRKTDIRNIHIASCGTSYHAALIGKYLIEKVAKMPVQVEIASEYRYRNPAVQNTLFIAVTQSGETADTLAAQREAKRRGAKTISICNVVGSTSTREADSVLYTRSGPEIGVAATKTFTSQLAAFCLLAIGMGMSRNVLSREEADAALAHFKEVPVLIEQTLALDGEIKSLADKLAPSRDFLYLARGINYPVALEGALKLKEISYIHSEGYPAGEMKHGPIALIDKQLPVVVLAPSNDLFDKMLSNIEEVRARGGRLIAVTDAPGALKDKTEYVIHVPSAHPLFTPFVNIVPLQLLACHIGIARNCDVDQPRNLAKSVTVE
jgi:glucosamine--fructose-6-phosphate aminotransferase (isomerizing)